jgi:hypothetical protein
MTLHAFSDWLSATSLSQLIQTTSWAIPGIQTVHIIALALVVTSALILGLRVVGRGLREQPLPVLAAGYERLIWVLLGVLLVSGGLLIVAEPGRTITNPAFYVKMTLLLLAMALTRFLVVAAGRAGSRPSPGVVAAATGSLLLWSGIIFAGRLIAYVQSY